MEQQGEFFPIENGSSSDYSVLALHFPRFAKNCKWFLEICRRLLLPFAFTTNLVLYLEKLELRNFLAKAAYIKDSRCWLLLVGC